MRKRETNTEMVDERAFNGLVGKIQTTTQALRQDALGIINRSVTARAWLTGCYIVEFEQGGKSRAAYGDGLLKRSDCLSVLAGRITRCILSRSIGSFIVFSQDWQFQFVTIWPRDSGKDIRRISNCRLWAKQSRTTFKRRMFAKLDIRRISNLLICWNLMIMARMSQYRRTHCLIVCLIPTCQTWYLCPLT